MHLIEIVVVRYKFRTNETTCLSVNNVNIRSFQRTLTAYGLSESIVFPPLILRSETEPEI